MFQLGFILLCGLTFEGYGYLLHHTTSEDIFSRCFRLPSCHCDRYHKIMTCGGKVNPLSQVPNFPEDRFFRTANLTENNIVSLSEYAFTNLTAVTKINLEYNRLSTVDPKAFSGLRMNTLNISHNQLHTLGLSTHLGALDASNNRLHTISFSELTRTTLRILTVAHNQLHTIPLAGLETLTELDLSYNQLQTVPAALINMTKLRDLRIQHNPIKVFHASLDLFVFVGCHLETLYFGSAELQTWPTYLHWLRHLTTLSVHGINMTSLPPEAFKGLWYLTHLHIEDSRISTLSQNAFKELRYTTHLFIENTEMNRIPSAICDLNSLKLLKFSGNSLVDIRHLLPSCQTPMVEVDIAYLENNSFTSFPNTYNIFPNLTRLYVNNNPHLTAITSNTIPDGSAIKELHLDGNGFTSIPSALEKLQHLTKLEMNDNRIMSLSRTLHFPSLGTLSLNNNPIHSISQSVFINVTIDHLNLRNTGQTTIPRGVSGLDGARFYIDLRENPVRCTCALRWAKPWVETIKKPGLWQSGRSVIGYCVNYNTTRLDAYIRRSFDTLCH